MKATGAQCAVLLVHCGPRAWSGWSGVSATGERWWQGGCAVVQDPLLLAQRRDRGNHQGQKIASFFGGLQCRRRGLWWQIRGRRSGYVVSAEMIDADDATVFMVRAADVGRLRWGRGGAGVGVGTRWLV